MELTSLERLKESRRLRDVEFPLSSLLLIYSKAPRLLYLNYFEDFKLLVDWLSPIAQSTYTYKHIPHYLLSYEINQLGAILNAHPSRIYQELQSILSLESDREDASHYFLNE